MVYGTAVIVEWAKSESVRNASTCCTDWELIGASTLADGAREIPEHSLTPSTSISILSVKINLFSQTFSVAISHCRCLRSCEASRLAPWVCYGCAMTAPCAATFCNFRFAFGREIWSNHVRPERKWLTSDDMATWLFAAFLLPPSGALLLYAAKDCRKTRPERIPMFSWGVCAAVSNCCQLRRPWKLSETHPSNCSNWENQKSDSLSWCFGLGTGWTSLRNGRGRPKLGHYLRHPHDIAHVPDVKLFFAPSCSNCLQCIECIGTGHGDCLSTQDRLN